MGVRAGGQALFGLGKPKYDGPMICIDCGYVVQSGFNELPRSYKCPQCLVGKNRFKAYQAAGAAYKSLAAQKKEARANRGKTAGGRPSPRDAAKAKQMQMQQEADGKKKGWFGR